MVIRLSNAILATAVGTFLGCGIPVAEAGPNGASTCTVTTQGPAFSAASPHLNNGKGEVDGNAVSGGTPGPFQVKIDGSYMSPATGPEPPVEQGGRYQIGIELAPDSPVTSFRGFLFHVSGDTDMSDSLDWPSTSEQTTQILESTADGPTDGNPATCAETISGATHVNNDDKTQGWVYLSVAADKPVGTTFTLAITVMENSTSWYHSTYPMEVAEGSAANGTDAPTASPVAGGTPATDAPTASPVSEEPTAAPSAGVKYSGSLLAIAAALVSVGLSFA